MIRTNLGRLPRRLKRLSRRISNYAVGVQRDVSIEIGKEVVLRTPHDTGLARGNWNPAVNRQPSTPITLLDPQGTLAPARIAAATQALRAGDTFYISNNIEYIDLLDRGYSPQAAAGFVKTAVDLGLRKGITRARKRVL